ncbi:MAG: carboxylesterase family protein [Prevotella sp.]|nr:carboxylesterase family protein [Prevotella sp.]
MALATALTLSACKGGTGYQQQPGSQLTEAVTSDSSSVTTTVAQGKIAGYKAGDINIFKGIPYAKANRFEAPVPADSWQGVRSCRAYGPTAPQGKRTGWESDEQAFAFDWDDGHAGEDCLRANVWTRGLNDGKKRPVMVWLHGGGFAAGSGQELPAYDGTRLAEEGDVVVVTINHRLNVLGYLDLSAFGEKYAQTGNLGMMDIVAALRWVKENISQFGGNPDNVTIFGQSGGGGKVSTLMAMPAAHGLFHKAIVESGSQLKCMDQKFSRRIGAAVVKRLGLTAATIDRIKTVPYDQLLAAGDSAIRTVKAEAEREGWDGFIFGWAPVVDGSYLPQHPFSPKAPAVSANIPMIIGTTLNEFCMSAYVPSLRNLTDRQVDATLAQRYGGQAEAFKRAFGKAYPSHKAQDMLDIDLIFRPMAVEQARQKAAQKAAPVYMYLFTWQSPVLNGILRSVHCMEIPFVFDNTARQAGMTGNTPEARALARKMSQAWISFAYTGKPQAEGLPEWTAYNPAKGATMIFDNQCRIVYNHDSELLGVARQFPAKPF